MAKEFDISELNKLILDLEKKGKNAKKGIKEGVRRTTENCQAMAIDMAPADTGTMRANIHMNVKEKGNNVTGTVEPLMEYSVYPEFGTGQKGKSSKIERPEGIHYKSDKWLVKIPNVGFRYTSGQEAQPYMYPAFLQQRDKLVPNIEKQLNKILNEK